MATNQEVLRLALSMDPFYPFVEVIGPAAAFIKYERTDRAYRETLSATEFDRAFARTRGML